MQFSIETMEYFKAAIPFFKRVSESHAMGDVQPANTPEQVERDAKGHWLKGVSGNPNGRPAIAKKIRELAQSKSERMIELLEQMALTAESEAARIAAMKEILDRAVGKPTQPVSGTDDPDKPQLPSIAVSFVRPEE